MPPQTLTGTLLGGRYRVGPMLGEGGMGAVYEAVQEGLDRKVALKVLHSHLSSDEELRGRFRREAKVVAMLGHPNVVQISDFQANEGEPPFLVMELLRGENLRDVLKRTPRLSIERVAYIAVQVLSALEAAHRSHIVHRDIKPDNIFLERTSVQADIVKLLDFGIAKLVDDKEEAAVKLTRQGLVVGTLSYMSPEQASGDPIDGRADLHALAASMYIALTGRKPFDGTTTATLIRAIMTEAPVPVSVIRPDIDVRVSDIVDRALAKRPADRFASASEMARALAPFAKPTPLEEPASMLPSTPVMTIRMPEEGAESFLSTTAKLTRRETEAPPKTISMPSPPESVAPRTTPIPPPTQRSSYHAIDLAAPGRAATAQIAPLAIAPPFVRKKKRSVIPWIVSSVVAFAVVAVASVTVLAFVRPWESAAVAPPSAVASTAPFVPSVVTATATTSSGASTIATLAPLRPTTTPAHTTPPPATHAPTALAHPYDPPPDELSPPPRQSWRGAH